MADTVVFLDANTASPVTRTLVIAGGRADGLLLTWSAHEAEADRHASRCVVAHASATTTAGYVRSHAARDKATAKRAISILDIGGVRLRVAGVSPTMVDV